MHVNDGTGTQGNGNITTNIGKANEKGGAQGQYSIAVGVNALADLSNTDAIAMGHNANVSGDYSIAIGSNAKTQYIDTIAIGKDAKATGNHAVALGGETESKGWYSVSVGYRAKNEGDGSISIGELASSDITSPGSTVIGVGSSVTNSGYSVILGRQSTIKGSVSPSPNSLVIGNNSQINDSNSAVAIGNGVNISNSSVNGVSIGMGTTIDNSIQGVVIGGGSSAKNSGAGIAIGANSEVSAARAIAIGTITKVSAEDSISIGTGNEVKGNKSSAIGDPSYIDTTATGTHVQGNDNGTATNPIKASESTFMGNTNLAGTAGTTGIHVVGNNNSVDSSNVMVMGNGINVGTGLDGAVVLGNASSADQYAAATDSTINGVTFEAAGYAGNTGLNNGSIVSVGATGTERQIKNVAAGAVTATSTDAVNGSQLYKTAETILKMPINMAGDSGDTVGLKLGKTVNIKGSVASGADVTDGNIAVVGDKATSTLSLKMAKNLTGLTSGTFTDATGNQTVINGAGVIVTPTGTGATPISITTSGINAGNQEIKGVKKGTTDDAAVNKKQMDDALAGISSTLTINDGTTDGSVNIKTGKLKVVGESGANALVTTTVSGDTITVGTSTKLQNAVTAAEKSADKDLSNLSATGSGTVKTLAQDAVKVAGTGLATVSDATAAGVKTYTVNVDEGKLVIDDTTGKIGANGATQGTTQGKNGVATTQDVASVVNSAIDKTKQALTDAKHDFAGDDATVISRKHGEQLNIKGGASTTATDLTSGNIAVVGDTTTGTLNIKMAKALTGLTSATYTDAAGNTQTVTGGSSTISDAAGHSTVVSKGGVTTTDGTNTTTVAPAGVTATDGTHTVTLGGSGISAGGTEIKNVGKATTDDAAVNKKQMDDAVKAATDSVSTLGDNKVSLGSDSGTTTAKKLSTTGGIKFNIKGETGANALITTSATGDDVTIAPTAKLTAAVTAAEKSADKDLSNISPAGETVIKNLAATSAQDAVKVTGTGLATVSDSTTGGVKTYNVDVKTGNLVVNAAGQAGAAGTTGAGGAAGADGVATTQNVASAINDAITKSKTDTAQAIADAEHKFDGDTGTTSVRKHGEVLSVKGGVTATTDLTTGNIGVVSDGAGTLNIRLAKVLSGLTSATYTDAAGNTQTVTGGSSTITDGAGNTTTITKGGMTTTDGTNTTTVAPAGVTATDGTNTVKLNGSGIDAGNTQIKNVGKATTDDAAVNKKQMDDAVKAATDSISTLGDNKVSLGSDSGTTTAKKLSTTGGIKFNIKGDTGANALITTSATGDDVTIAPTAKLSAAVTAAENSANKDLSNLSAAGDTYIKNLAKTAASWNVETNGAGTTAVAGGDTVNFINGDNIAITNTGRSITIGTAKNVSFDKVTVGGVVIDKNNGIDAGGKEITNVGPATSGNSAVNKTQMDTAITNAVNKATTDAKHDFGGDDATVVTRKHGEKLNIKGGASTTAADLTSGNIAVLGDATTGTLNIRMAKALTGLSSATFTTPSGTTVINGGGMTITPSTTGAAPISITTGGINAGNTEIKNVAAGTTPNSAVNKQQMDSAISNATANVGFNTAGNTGTGSVSNGQTLTITGTNGIETNASGQSITVGLDAATRAQINNATTTANNAAKKDLSNIDNAGKQVIKDTAAWNVKVNGAAAEIVKGGDTVTFNDGDNIKVTNTGKDITIATKKDVSFDKVTVGNVVIDKNTNRISGLANAANNDEAVNLGQMNAAISTATAGTGNIKYKANGGTQNSVALTTGFDFKGDSNIQITADPANSGVINYKLNPALTGITSISGGTGAPTITLNAGSGSTPGNVSINSNLDMGGKQINNIGAATHAGDAVNKAQMDQALQNIAGASSNAAKSYAYKAGAGAAALAALKPIQYDPLEPTQIMAGIGNYKSQTAVALGVAHYTNENTMFNLGVSLDSHDGIVNAGVTHKFGYSPEKKAIPDKYKGGPISSIYVMQDEVTALQAIVQKQAAENEALRQQNEDMQRKVDMILSKIH